jgi:hypothetical protein
MAENGAQDRREIPDPFFPPIPGALPVEDFTQLSPLNPNRKRKYSDELSGLESQLLLNAETVKVVLISGNRYKRLKSEMALPARRFDKMVQELVRLFNAQSREGKYGVSKADKDKVIQKALLYLYKQVAGLSNPQNNAFGTLINADNATLDRLDSLPSKPSLYTNSSAFDEPAAPEPLQNLLLNPGHAAKCTFPEPSPLSRTAFKEISLRLGPAKTIISDTLELQILAKLNPCGNLIKALEYFIINLKKPGMSYDDPEHCTPLQVLSAVQGRARTEPKNIKAMDADAEFLRAAWDLIELVDVMEAHLGKEIHSMSPRDKIAVCQAMEVKWNTHSVWDAAKAPHIPEKYFDWVLALQKGRDLSAWCTEISRGRNNKNRGILVLLMFASVPNDHTPVNVSGLWGEICFYERVNWIGEYVRLYMRELRELVRFLDHVAVKVYKFGYLDYSEREEFCQGLDGLAKKWIARANNVAV